ncbi:VWA domain-containing protein [Ponticaulis profundi]|uniref:VWA domain-containing protein n=1 Tax=Ponticaulis profundi TaxID=2665222 RepID=A0ABW1SA51_9PROT
MNMKTLLGAGLAIGLAACATSANAKTEPVELSSYILLDRTGSMNSIWEEALGSVNAYAASVVEPDDGPQVNNTLTLAVFDAQEGLQFEELRKNVKGEAWSDITTDEVSPRGMTPLFDAIGKIIATAETDAPEKAVIVIMTDGKENASREFTKASARAALDRAEKKGWQVVFLGAEFANFADADAVGVSGSKQMAVSRDQLGVTMENLAKKNRGYAQELEESVEFNDADRSLAEEEDVKQRKGGN